MKTRTAAFDQEWADPARRFGVYKVLYARRYWNGSAFVLEAQQTLDNVLTIANIGPITQKLDTPIESSFLNSNCTLKLLNKGWAWLPANTTDGQWKLDAVALQGYVPFGSQFQIYYGFTEAGGDETLAIFTGYVDDLIFDSLSGQVQVSLCGREVLLQNSDAMKTSTTLNAQVTVPANGDGSNLSFSTNKTSIWRVRTVYVNGVAKVQGASNDYTLTNVNSLSVNCTIVFNAGKAPPNGQAVTWDGDQWYLNNSIATLVGALCDTAGIASANRQIDEPVFVGGAASNKFVGRDVSNVAILDSSSADWRQGTVLTNVEATGNPGDVRQKWLKLDDFADGDYTNNPTWGTSTCGTGSVSVSANRLVLTPGNCAASASVPCAVSSGTWRYISHNIDNDCFFGFALDSNSGGLGGPSGHGYSLFFVGTTLKLRRHDGGLSSADLASVTVAYSADDEWRVTRNSSGVMNVYQNGVLVIGPITDATYNSGLYLVISDTNGGGGSSWQVTNIYVSNAIDGTVAVSTATPVYESAVQDCLQAPVAWGTLDQTQTLNGGTIAYATASSTDGLTFDAYIAISGTNVIQSALKRYIKIRATFTRAAYSVVSPTVSRLNINFSTANLFIAAADFTGLTCAQAINTLAIMGGMEWGTKGDGTLFFRSKAVAAGYDIDLDESGAILEITSYSLGYADISNVGQVTYGGYISTKDAASESEASPTSEANYGRIVYALSLGNFLFSNSAQVADSIARKLYLNNYRPKKKLTVLCRTTPQIDTADRARISFYDGDLLRANIFGDKAQKGFPSSSTPMNVLARKLIMKIVGGTHNVMKGTTQLNLEEILP